ncbi:MAG TPA: transketolase C-terminal domain-containing protein [Acetobacteraceae bacterium]|nr:transketolase C-terminal domain-containing protein [Acetobacteraceae bacterium]
MSETFDCRQAFADELMRLAEADPRVVAVCNDSVGSSNLGAFQRAFPDRLINVGIAEQDMVGVAAGLALGGFVPFVSAASPFLTARALEQIKADIAYSRHHVVLCGQSPGMSYGELGPTHHSIEDLALMRAISGLDIIVPAGPRQTRAAMRWALGAGRPVFMRVARFKVPETTPAEAEFAPGHAVQLRDGSDVAILACGALVSRALAAADVLAERGVAARVLDMAWVRPLDEAAVLAAARECGRIVTAEEALDRGGLGGAVAELVVRHHPVPMRILGVPEFAPTGSAAFLLEHFGLSAEAIVRAALELVEHG